MSTVKKLVDSWWVFFLSLAALAGFSVAQLWPASYWLEVKSVNAGPAQPWSVVPMAVVREIKRDFRGQWTVGVKRFGDAGWVAFCSASGATWYRASAELPAELNMSWWTDNGCSVLPEGKYVIDTTWQIRPSLAFLPDKDVTVRSNIFEVKP